MGRSPLFLHLSENSPFTGVEGEGPLGVSPDAGRVPACGISGIGRARATVGAACRLWRHLRQAVDTSDCFAVLLRLGSAR